MSSVPRRSSRILCTVYGMNIEAYAVLVSYKHEQIMCIGNWLFNTAIPWSVNERDSGTKWLKCRRRGVRYLAFRLVNEPVLYSSTFFYEYCFG